MAGIVKRNNWLHLVWYENKKRFIKPLKLRNNIKGLKEAEKIKVDVEWLLSHGQPIDIQTIKRNLINGTFQPIIEAPKVESKPTLKEGWEEFSLIKKKSIKTNYYRTIQALIKLIGDIPIDQVTDKHSVLFQNSLEASGLKNNTIVNYYGNLFTMWHFFIKKKYTDEVPFEKVKFTKIKVVTIPEREMKLILDHLNNYENKLNYFLIKFLYMTGMRVGEALKFRKSDIDWDENIITISNTKKDRLDKFPIYPKFKPLLQQMVNEIDDEIFFRNYNNKSTWEMFHKACEAVSIRKYKVHDIRRSFATIMASKLSQTELQTVVRHKSIQTTMDHYVNHNLQDIGTKM